MLAEHIDAMVVLSQKAIFLPFFAFAGVKRYCLLVPFKRQLSHVFLHRLAAGWMDTV